MIQFRSAVRDSYITSLEAFMTASPTLLDRVYRARPPSLAEQRAVFVGRIAETLPDMHSGVWQREINVDVIVTMHFGDNAETTDNLEEVADALIDWLADDAHAHLVGENTEQQPIRSDSVELDDGGGLIVPGVAITCRARIQQGRS